MYLIIVILLFSGLDLKQDTGVSWEKILRDFILFGIHIISLCFIPNITSFFTQFQ